MMWWYGPGMGGWRLALMTVGMVLFWALIILGLIAIVRFLQTAGGRAQVGDADLDAAVGPDRARRLRHLDPVVGGQRERQPRRARREHVDPLRLHAVRPEPQARSRRGQFLAPCQDSEARRPDTPHVGRQA